MRADVRGIEDVQEAWHGRVGLQAWRVAQDLLPLFFIFLIFLEKNA